MSPAAELLEDRTLLDGTQVLQQALVDFHGDDLVGKDGEMASIGFDLTLVHNEFTTHAENGAGVKELGIGSGSVDAVEGFIENGDDALLFGERGKWNR